MSYEQIVTDAPKFFIAYGPNGIRHVGETGVGQITISGQPNFVDASTEAELLETADSLALEFPDIRKLPDDGELISKGFYSTEKHKLVICKEDTLLTKEALTTDSTLFQVSEKTKDELNAVKIEVVK